MAQGRRGFLQTGLARPLSVMGAEPAAAAARDDGGQEMISGLVLADNGHEPGADARRED